MSTLTASIANMEKLNFEYSLKNIQTPSDTSYKLKLTEKIESVIKRMRWKAQHFLKDDKQNESKERKENCAFQTRTNRDNVKN